MHIAAQDFGTVAHVQAAYAGDDAKFAGANWAEVYLNGDFRCGIGLGSRPVAASDSRHFFLVIKPVGNRYFIRRSDVFGVVQLNLAARAIPVAIVCGINGRYSDVEAGVCRHLSVGAQQVAPGQTVVRDS